MHVSMSTMSTLAVVMLTVPAEAALNSWASYGEEASVSALAAPVLSDDIIHAVNSHAAQGWTAGRNSRFEGATLADAKVLMGTLQGDASTFLPVRPASLVEMAAAATLPTDFDWRTDPRADNCPSLREIRDQANCGSCWAFGSVEAMTDRICLASKGTRRAHLSAEDVASCDHLGDMGCSGGIPSTAYTYYHTTGIVTGGNYGDKSMCYSYQLAPCAHHTNSSKYPACSTRSAP